MFLRNGRNCIGVVMAVTTDGVGPGIGWNQEREHISEMGLCHWPEDQVSNPSAFPEDIRPGRICLKGDDIKPSFMPKKTSGVPGQM